MEVFNLDLIPGRSNPVIHCSQFDEGRTFRANLFEGSSVYTLTGAETLTLIEKKLDGNMVTISVTNTSDSYVEFATTQQMTALEGEQLCELRIENGGNLIGTLNFLLDCEPSPDTGIASDSAIHNLEAQIAADVAIEVANQYDSNNVLFDTAPTSGHGVPYAVTSGGLWSWLRDLPLRAYPTASGSIATFDTSLALPLQDCTIAINAVQESGTPTPSSPKLISGFTGANIHVADDETPHVIDNVTAISWQSEAGTVYGGSLDVTTGVLTVTYAEIDLGGLEWLEWTPSGKTYKIFYAPIAGKKIQQKAGDALCSIYEYNPNSQTANLGNYEMTGHTSYNRIYIRNDDYADVASFKTGMSGVMLYYELVTPVTYQLTPTQISAIVGTNNVFTDTNGNTSVVYACSLKDYIDGQ